MDGNIIVGKNLLQAGYYFKEMEEYTVKRLEKIYKIVEMQAFDFYENTLIKDGKFRLLRKKALIESNIEYEVIQIDDTETPIERPKKT